MRLTDLPPTLDDRAHTVRAVVETPRGSRHKFTYDLELAGFELKRLLPAGLAFPLEFGFVPSTRAEDGDPIDILVVADEPLPQGTILTVCLVGVLEAIQTDSGGVAVRNDRLIGVSCETSLYTTVRTLDDLGPAFAKDLERFWIAYNNLRGATFEVVSWGGPADAVALIREAIAAHS
jgi:inorganic pyrophosphatase